MIRRPTLKINLKRLGNWNFIFLFNQRSCIGPNFAPKVSLSSKDETEDYISRVLGVEGFACTLNSVTNYHSCELCPQGTYSNGRNECIPCPKGTQDV